MQDPLHDRCLPCILREKPTHPGRGSLRWHMDESWIITEAKLWGDFMAPSRRRVVMHSMSPEKQKEARAAVAKMKEREFSREWEAYERWLQH